VSPAPPIRRADYGRYRERQAVRSRARSAAGREIGRPPACADRGRRSRCAKDLRRFCETYLGLRFALAFSPDHLRCLAKLERATLEGGQFAFAMPRGSGKTSLVVAAALWAVLYGHRSFVVLVGATDPAAVELLEAIKTEVEVNPIVGNDFPGACFPVRALEGVHNRAAGQTCRGVRTRIEWTSDTLVFPTVKGSKAAGAVVKALGITGRVRGLTHTSAAGKSLRPDLVILDDPQTDESAASPTQTAKREALITTAVLGLAGPKRKIAAVMPCTCIAPGDLAERALDHAKHPEWTGERTRLLYHLPTDTALWERYAELRRDALANGRGLGPATAFYRANRAAMDEGAAVAWPERYHDGEASAIQHAMNLKLADERAFRAEYQNDPDPGSFAGAREYSAEALAGRLSGLERGLLPREASLLTAGLDVGSTLLWWLIAAWNERGGGCVVDYGCWPAQHREVFTAEDARPSLAERFPGHTEAQRTYAGLGELAGAILGRDYPKEGEAAGALRVERCLVDSGYQTAAVQQFCRASTFRDVLTPSKGVGRTTTARGVGEWPKKAGERAGYHWKLTAPARGSARTLLFDPDPWKSLLFERLTAPLGPGLALALFGSDPRAHRLAAMHLAAEYSTPATLRGVTFDKWAVRPDRPDNHLLDCLVLAAVAASLAGLVWPAGDTAAAGARPRERRRVDYAQMQREAQRQRLLGG